MTCRAIPGLGTETQRMRFDAMARNKPPIGLILESRGAVPPTKRQIELCDLPNQPQQPTSTTNVNFTYSFIHNKNTQLLSSPDPNLIPNLTPYPFSDTRLASPYPLILLSSISASCHHSIIEFLFFFAVTVSPAESTSV